MKHAHWLVLAFLLSTNVHSQQNEKVQPADSFRKELVSRPLGIVRQVRATARDFIMFRDPQWSVLTIGQIGAASADAVTSLNNLHACASCSENGVSAIFVGQHPDAHKYVIAGAIEIGVEAVAAHYFRNRGPKEKLYWKILWVLPQSFSLYEHAHAAQHNTSLDLGCSSQSPSCN
jgi:hypothetical protein